MKTVTVILKIVAALAAVAGAIYVIATYGDKMVAWAKKLLNCTCECECECDCECDCACDGECTCECESADPAAVPAEEAAPAEEEAPAEDGVVEAEEADFEG